jgi:hypothetical protein
MTISDPSGAVTNSTGDVDRDGELVGQLDQELNRRLMEAIGDSRPELAGEQLAMVRRLLGREPWPHFHGDPAGAR